MSVTEDAPRGTRRRGEALLGAIYDAVLAELSESGYGAMSIERVAERARTGKASIYRRWPSRFDLVVEALDHSLPGFAEDPPDTGSVREDLLAVLRRIATTMAGPAGSATRACLGSLDHDPAIAGALRERVLPRRKAALEDILRRAADRGEVRAEAITERVVELGPMLLHAEALMRGVPIPDSSVVAIVDEIILPVLRPAAPSA